MKNKVKFLITAVLSVLLFSSCSMPDGKGKILIVNQTGNDIIMSAEVQEEYEDGYTLYWSREINDTTNPLYVKDVSFYIETGDYYVRIFVKKYNSLTNDYYEKEENYKIGYKNPIHVWKDETSTITYDGNGIYHTQQ